MADTLVQSLLGYLGGLPKELVVFIISLFPVVELRGGLIAAALLKMDLIPAFISCYIGNMLPIPFILFFIKKIFAWMRTKNAFFEKIVSKMELRSEKKSKGVETAAGFGLFLLVAIPLPGTGGWTGALVASLTNMDIKKSLPIIALGVLAAGLIMTVLTYLLPNVFNFF